MPRPVQHRGVQDQLQSGPRDEVFPATDFNCRAGKCPLWNWSESRSSPRRWR